MAVSSPPAPARAASAVRALRAAAAARGALSPPALLGAALGAAVAYAAFSSGAAGIPEESRLQVFLAAAAAAALAALLFGSGLRAAAPPAAWAGVGLLAAFAAWSGLSLAWTVAPDLSWLDLNRELAYALVAALALVLGASLPRAPERVALAYLAIATAVALYALGGKVAPWLSIPGVLDLDHAAEVSRLRAPLGYWNALALFCALAVPTALRTGADLSCGRRARLLGRVALVPLLVTVGLTYSRGGLLALAVALVVLIAASRDRLRLTVLAGIGAVAAAPALLIGFMSDDLTTDGVSAGARFDDGLLMLLALVAGTLFMLRAATKLRRAEARLALTPGGRRTATRAGLAGATLASLFVLGSLALSERGIGGTIEAEFESFSSTRADRQADPARLLQTNSGNRWDWWGEALGAFTDRPLSGHGAGSFPLVHLAYRDNDLLVREAHSVPLQFLAEAGLPGALLALGGVGLLAAAALRRVRAGPDPYAVALLAAVAAFGVHLWFDWDWDIPALVLPLLVFLGVLAARPPGAGDGPAAQRPPIPGLRQPLALGLPRRARALALGLGTAAACLLAVSALLPALARDAASDALAAAARGTPEDLAEAAGRARTAMRLDPLAAEPVTAAATIAERRGQYERAAALLADAAEREPADPDVWLRIAAFNAKRDDLEGVLRAGSVALRLDPRNKVARAVFVFGDPSALSASATGTPLPESPPPLGAVPPATPPAG